jgi:hypothetical protein
MPLPVAYHGQGDWLVKVLDNGHGEWSAVAATVHMARGAGGPQPCQQ